MHIVSMDQNFHRGLARATRNRLLLGMITTLHNNACRYWYFGLQQLDAPTIRADIEAHLEVIEAIRKRDAAVAMASMRGVLGQFPSNMKMVFESGALFT